MSGFVQPQWSGFEMPDPTAATEARHTRHKPGHELDRISLTVVAPTRASRQHLAGRVEQRLLPVTPASPHQHKALAPGSFRP